MAWPVYIGRPQGKLGELGAQFTARGAAHPLQALHNFAVGIVAGRMTRVIIARGLDPCFGFLHDGRKPGRLSLVWDAIEPLRPELVTRVFEFVGERVFKKDDFAVFEGGVVRLSAKLAREIAGLVIRKFPLAEYVKTVKMIERSMG